jgi:HSP20 family protein
MLARFNQLDSEFENLVRTLALRDVALPRQAFEKQQLAAPADVIETETGFEVRVDLPGHDPKNIEVRLEDDTLTISSVRNAEARTEKDNWLRVERVHGTFTRSFVLPAIVDGSRVEAKHENGVLTVMLPKREEARPRSIQVKVG